MDNERIYNIEDRTKNPEEIADPEIKKVFDDLILIAQRVGGDFGMKVMVGKEGEGSFYNPDEVSITIDPLHVKESPSEAKFVVAHEGGHRAITRSPRELGVPEKVTQQLYGEVGFGYLQNAIEDPADNTWVTRRYPGLDGYFKENYDKQFEQENAVLSSPEVAQIAQRLGYWPKFSQYGSEVIRYWHQRRFSRTLDKDVERVLKTTLHDVEKSIASIPDPQKYNEREVSIKSRERFQINTEKVWPHVKTLIEEDIKSGNQRQIAQELYDKLKQISDKQKKKEGVEASGDRNNADELQKEIDKLREDLNKSGLSSEQQEELATKIEVAIKESQEKSEEDGGKDDGAEQGQEGKSREGHGLGSGVPVPVDQLSDTLKKALQAYFDKLPQNKKQQIQDEVKKQLEGFEDALNKTFAGKLNKDNPPSHSETQKQEQQKQAQEQDKQKILKEKQELQKRLEQVREGMMTEYDKSRKEVAGLIDYLYLRLRRILKPEEYGGQEGGYSSGQILDITRAMQGEQDISQKQKMWIRETAPERRDYRFWHLVDLSGSMQGDAIRETFKGFIVTSEAVDRIEDYNGENLTVHQGITGFHNRVFEYKNFRERFTKNVEERLAEVVKRPEDEDSGTNTYIGTITALENLKQDLGATGNYLFTFTDGNPNYQVRDDLKKLIKETKDDRKKRKIKLGIIWVGAVSNEREGNQQLDNLVKEYGYDFGLLMPAASEKKGSKNFAERLADLLEDVVENPEKY